MDNDKRLSAYLSLNDRKVIRYKDSSPLQTTTVIVGGFFDMQVGRADKYILLPRTRNNNKSQISPQKYIGLCRK